MSLELCLFTVFLCKSILIVVAFSPLDSGKVFKMLWELIYPLVKLSILRLAVRLKGLIKFWKTCSELVLSLSGDWYPGRLNQAEATFQDKDGPIGLQLG